MPDQTLTINSYDADGALLHRPAFGVFPPGWPDALRWACLAPAWSSWASGWTGPSPAFD